MNLRAVPLNTIRMKSWKHFSNLKSNNRFYTSPNTVKQQNMSTIIPSPDNIKSTFKTQPKPSKLKELSRKYGAAGIVVYIMVGCADLAFIIGGIQLAGLENVKKLEKNVLDMVYNTGEKFGMKREHTPVTDKLLTTNETLHVDEIIQSERDTPSFASVFILAYGIHKTLMLPVRIGITTAITPVIARKLHQTGWARYFPKIFSATVPRK